MKMVTMKIKVPEFAAESVAAMFSGVAAAPASQKARPDGTVVCVIYGIDSEFLVWGAGSMHSTIHASASAQSQAELFGIAVGELTAMCRRQCEAHVQGQIKEGRLKEEDAEYATLYLQAAFASSASKAERDRGGTLVSDGRNPMDAMTRAIAEMDQANAERRDANQ